MRMRQFWALAMLAICAGCNESETSECGNGVIERGEACDGAALNGVTCTGLGFSSGAVKCTNTCEYDLSDCRSASVPVCGNGMLESGEECDTVVPASVTCELLGKGSGQLKCSACRLDMSGCGSALVPACGNGVVESGEECDTVVSASVTCESLGKGSGLVKCSNCRIDTSGCVSAQPSVCGDGVRSGLEECDGEDLGGADCASVNPAKAFGHLGCTSDCHLASAFCYAADPGLQAPMPDAENTDSQCSNGLNDFSTVTNTGAISTWFDCSSYSCAQSPIVQVCQMIENDDKSCSDGIDNAMSSKLHQNYRNQQNGLTDCEDPSCFKNWRVTVCQNEAPKWELGAECGDGLDNDGDGLKDCDDPDCLHAGMSSCAMGSRKRVLFDNAHHQIAGGVDWIIDVTGRHPYPSMPKTETEWHGSLSAFALDLLSSGNFIVETLPQDRAFTYGSTSDYQDLSQYDILVVVEPSSPITAQESKAVYDFVQNGGGLLLVANHEGADRDGNSYDSVRALNEMLAAMPGAAGKESNPFGFYVLPGAYGSNSTARAADGTAFVEADFSLNTYGASGFQIVGASAQNILIDSKSSESFAVQATSGKGRIVAVGDSAIIGDGTTYLGNAITTENGYAQSEATRNFFLKVMNWLAGQ